MEPPQETMTARELMRLAQQCDAEAGRFLAPDADVAEWRSLASEYRQRAIRAAQKQTSELNL